MPLTSTDLNDLLADNSIGAITAADLRTISTDFLSRITAVEQPPLVVLNRPTVVATTNNGEVAISFNASTHEIVDTPGWHSTGTNPSRITVATTGRYRVTLTVIWDNYAATATHLARIYVNGTLVDRARAYFAGGGGANKTHHWSGVLSLTANDYVELKVIQVQGNLNVTNSTLSVEWIRT